jgi:signal transduction histidine kinase
MTSIKPPSSGTSGPNALPERADAAGGSLQTDRTESSSFQQSLSEANQAHQVGGTTAAGADSVGTIARAVESGSISLEQAVEQLVEQTLERAGKHLTGEQRSELTELLRSALANDPTLAGLRG